MKVKITAEVNQVRHYDLVRVEIEVPDDASPEQIRQRVRERLERLQTDVDEVPGAIEMDFSHVSGHISDIEGGDISDEEYEDLTHDGGYSIGDEEART